MLQHVVMSSGDAALVVNGVVVMTADPSMDDPAHVEMVAEKLAEALEEPLQRLEMKARDCEDAGAEDWTWEEVVEELAIRRAVVQT